MGKKVVILVYICHVSLLENHDLRCCIENRDILQTSTFREMCRGTRICFANFRLVFFLVFFLLTYFFRLVTTTFIDLVFRTKRARCG